MNVKRYRVFLGILCVACVIAAAFAPAFAAENERRDSINEVEPNGTWEEAQELVSGDTVSGRIASGSDADWYKIKFDSEGTANFWVWNTQGSDRYNISLELYQGDKDHYKKCGLANVENGQTYIEAYEVEADTWYLVKLTGAAAADYEFRARLLPAIGS